MLNNLTLYSNSDIFLDDFQVKIHQPTINEIAYIGEEEFLTGCQILLFNKNDVNFTNGEGQTVTLDMYSDFEIYILFLTQEPTGRNEEGLRKFLQLYFLGYDVEIDMDKKFEIVLTKEDKKVIIDNDNFLSLKQDLIKLTCLDKLTESGNNYNPQDAMAKRIADKLRKRHQKENSEKSEGSIFGKYASILAVGESKDMNSLMNYTIPQLVYEFDRFMKKYAYDAHTAALLAGASNLDDVDNWME